MTMMIPEGARVFFYERENGEMVETSYFIMMTPEDNFVICDTLCGGESSLKIVGTVNSFEKAKTVCYYLCECYYEEE